MKLSIRSPYPERLNHPRYLYFLSILRFSWSLKIDKCNEAIVYMSMQPSGLPL